MLRLSPKFLRLDVSEVCPYGKGTHLVFIPMLAESSVGSRRLALVRSNPQLAQITFQQRHQVFAPSLQGFASFTFGKPRKTILLNFAQYQRTGWCSCNFYGELPAHALLAADLNCLSCFKPYFETFRFVCFRGAHFTAFPLLVKPLCDTLSVKPLNEWPT